MKTKKSGRKILKVSIFCYIFFVILINPIVLSADQPLSATDVLELKTCSEARISPDGKWIAYTISTPRKMNEDPGGSYSELYIVSIQSGQIIPFLTGRVNISEITWSPAGDKISFLMKRGEKANRQVWAISLLGGEAQQVTQSKTDVLGFAWHPFENKIIYIAVTPDSKRQEELIKNGYDFIFYQENLKHRNLYLQYLEYSAETPKIEQLTSGLTVWEFCISPDGKAIAAAISPENLIDHHYMFRNIYLLDLSGKNLRKLSYNPGKLGNFKFSPDSKKLAYTAALSREDHQVSQALVIDISRSEVKNLTIPDFRGHVNWVDWLDNKTIIYRAGEGVWATLSAIDAEGGDRKILFNSEKEKIVFDKLNMDKSYKVFAMIGSTPKWPGEVCIGQPGKAMKRLTNTNPDLDKRNLGKQEVIHYQSRDGLEIEGLLIYPLDYKPDKTYPLIVYVHGGPEQHYYNQWVTAYSTPGQVMAGKGYLVFYPNYRASTGYGVNFAREGFGDPAGKEFDDIADGIDYLVESGLADSKRVGMAGGSYGGYASAWFATYYTKHVRAVCMSAGVSDLISRMGTTDIPYEELYVHSGKKLEEMWDLALRRSPIYWAHQSKTAVLICCGTADTRVHPSQSMELFWRLKMNDHPAVRLIQYPGEGHGISRQLGRNDIIQRQIQWMDWYVKDLKPFDGPMPLLDISDYYGDELLN
jgi:dipeptidyl aminopeptidase/acylaminoacyl peptidase